MIINNIEIEFDATNPEDYEKFQSACEEYEKEIEKIAEMKDADAMRTGIDSIKKLFLRATGKDVLKDVKSLLKALKIYDEFLEEIYKQRKELEAIQDRIFKRAGMNNNYKKKR